MENIRLSTAHLPRFQTIQPPTFPTLSPCSCRSELARRGWRTFHNTGTNTSSPLAAALSANHLKEVMLNINWMCIQCT